MRKTLWALLIICLSAPAGASSGLGASSTEGCPTAIFRNKSVLIPPDPEVPEVFKRWSGLFGESRWDSILCHSFAVLKVEKDWSAKVLYAWGPAPMWTRFPAHASYRRADRGQQDYFSAPRAGAEVTYTLD